MARGLLLLLVLLAVPTIGAAQATDGNPAPVPAAEQDSPDLPFLMDRFVEIHAFGSQGAFITFENDYIDDDSTEGSFDFTEVGINFSREFSDSLRFGVQFFAQNEGRRGSFRALIDWFNIDWRFRDWMGFRAGRLKIPYGLFNEIRDIDAARIPILLPQSVYPLQGREILFSHTGAELYGYIPIGPAGDLGYRAFIGSILLSDFPLVAVGAGFEADTRLPWIYGGRLMWETPLEGLRFAGTFQRLHVDSRVFIPTLDPIKINNYSYQWVASAEYRMPWVTVTAEYARWNADQKSSDPVLSPPIDDTAERWYVMVSAPVTPWLQTAAYYALDYPSVRNRSGFQNRQHDVALTLRFDLNLYWLVKLEGHYYNGAAGLLDPLRLGVFDLSTAQEHWGALFVKTTATF